MQRQLCQNNRCTTASSFDCSTGCCGQGSSSSTHPSTTKPSAASTVRLDTSLSLASSSRGQHRGKPFIRRESPIITCQNSAVSTEATYYYRNLLRPRPRRSVAHPLPFPPPTAPLQSSSPTPHVSSRVRVCWHLAGWCLESARLTQRRLQRSRARSFRPSL